MVSAVPKAFGVIPACPESLFVFKKDSRPPVPKAFGIGIAGMTPKNKHSNNGRPAVSVAGFFTLGERNVQDIGEIPKNQRHLKRYRLEDIFTYKVRKNKLARDRKTREAVGKYGYKQKEIADNFGMHYSIISRLMAKK